MEYSVRKIGHPYTAKYRIYFEQRPAPKHHDDGDAKKIPISPFHDIPLYHDKSRGILNMVVEVPRWSQAKFEVSPVRQVGGGNELSLYIQTTYLVQSMR